LIDKKVLVIGFGSMGLKHCLCLEKFFKQNNIYVLTQQKNCKYKKINSLNKIKKLSPYYIVIASSTFLHFKQLKYIEKHLNKKIILVEKPLFKNYQNLKVKKNKVFVAYNLRFNPVIQNLKKMIKDEEIYSINIKCSSDLKKWRKNIDYKKSNSAKKKYGGGVLLELSHEIDYLQWIFGKISSIDYSDIGKLSDLKIDCEDNAFICGNTSKSKFKLDLNFHSFKDERKIEIFCKNKIIYADLINNEILILKKKTKKKIKYNFKMNQSYMKQHESILKNNHNNLCGYEDGIYINKIIDEIKKKK
jgi:predicted dehydrogenase